MQQQVVQQYLCHDSIPLVSSDLQASHVVLVRVAPKQRHLCPAQRSNRRWDFMYSKGAAYTRDAVAAEEVVPTPPHPTPPLFSELHNMRPKLRLCLFEPIKKPYRV